MGLTFNLGKVTCMVLLLSVPILTPNVLARESSSLHAAIYLAQGSRSDQVKGLQARLKYLGYFKADVTGYYGPITTSSVKWFQSAFGLPKATGIVDDKTWDMLLRATKDFHYADQAKQLEDKKQEDEKPTISRSSCGFSENEIRQLERAAYSEARGEPYEGQVAIVAVILNRIKDPRFPNSVPGVIFEPGAFTAVSDGQFWGLTPNETAKKAVFDAINGWDPTEGAVYYFNPATATNKWIWSRPLIKKIGKHRFCK